MEWGMAQDFDLRERGTVNFKSTSLLSLLLLFGEYIFIFKLSGREPSRDSDAFASHIETIVLRAFERLCKISLSMTLIQSSSRSCLYIYKIYISCRAKENWWNQCCSGPKLPLGNIKFPSIPSELGQIEHNISATLQRP